MVAMNDTMQIAERQMPDGDASVQHSAKVLDWASSTQAEHELSRANSFDPRQLVREWEAGMEHHRRPDAGRWSVALPDVSAGRRQPHEAVVRSQP